MANFNSKIINLAIFLPRWYFVFFDFFHLFFFIFLFFNLRFEWHCARCNREGVLDYQIVVFFSVWHMIVADGYPLKAGGSGYRTVFISWESTVVKSAPVQLAAHVRHCRAKPCKKIEGKEGWTRVVFFLDPVTLTLEGALEAALQLQKGVRKFGPAHR